MEGILLKITHLKSKVFRSFSHICLTAKPTSFIPHHTPEKRQLLYQLSNDFLMVWLICALPRRDFSSQEETPSFQASFDPT